MIKINLLGEESATSSDSRVWMVAYGASVVLSFVLFVFLQIDIGNTIDDLKIRSSETESQLARLKEKTKEVRDLEARKNELMSMTLAIATLKKTQEGPVRLLDDIDTAVPDKLWLRDVNAKQNTLRMEGLALTDEALVDFMRGLEKSLYFEKVDLIERITVPLVQINTLNTFDNVLARYVIRGEKEQVTTKIGELRAEAERLGLQFNQGLPPEIGSKEENNSPEAKSTKLSFSSLGQMRIVGGRPVIYAWESLEQVKAENFTIEAKIRLTPKTINMEAITASLVVAHQPTPTAKVKKIPAKEE